VSGLCLLLVHSLKLESAVDEMRNMRGDERREKIGDIASRGV